MHRFLSLFITLFLTCILAAQSKEAPSPKGHLTKDNNAEDVKEGRVKSLKQPEKRKFVIAKLEKEITEIKAEKAELKTQLHSHQVAIQLLLDEKREILSDLKAIRVLLGNVVKAMITHESALSEDFTSQVNAFQATIDKLTSSMKSKEEEITKLKKVTDTTPNQ